MAPDKEPQDETLSPFVDARELTSSHNQNPSSALRMYNQSVERDLTTHSPCCHPQLSQYDAQSCQLAGLVLAVARSGKRFTQQYPAGHRPCARCDWGKCEPVSRAFLSLPSVGVIQIWSAMDCAGGRVP